MKWPSLCQRFQDIKTKTLGIVNQEYEKEDSSVKNYSANNTCDEEKMVNSISENPCEGEEYTGVKQLTDEILRGGDESKKQSYEEEDGRESEDEVSNCEDREEANTSSTSYYEEDVPSYQENIDDIGKNSYLVNHFYNNGNESPAENENEIIAKENRDDQCHIEEDAEVAADSGDNYLISGEEDESNDDITQQFENNNGDKEEMQRVDSPANDLEYNLENHDVDENEIFENDETVKGSEIVDENRKNYLFLTQGESEENPEDSDADSGLQTEDDESYYVDIKKGTIAEKENGAGDELVPKPDAVNQELTNFDSSSTTEMQISTCFEYSTNVAPNNNLLSDTQDVDEATSKELSTNDKKHQEAGYEQEQTSPAQCMETQPTETRAIDGQVRLFDGGAMQMINNEQVPTVEGGSIQIIDGGEMRMDGGSVQMINGGQMQMTGGGSVQTLNSGHMQMMNTSSVQMVHEGQVEMMDAGSVQIAQGGQVQMMDAGSVQMINGGQVQMVDGGQAQMMDAGSVQMINGGQVQMLDGGQMQMMDGGSVQMINNGQVQMLDGGQAQMMDAGSVQMISGGQVQMVDGGQAQMMDGGSVQIINGGQVQMVDGGQVQMLNAGYAQTVNGGQVQMMDVESVQMVDSEQLQMIGGSSGQITEVTMVGDNQAQMRVFSEAGMITTSMCSAEIVSQGIAHEMTTQEISHGSVAQEYGTVGSTNEIQALEMSSQEVPIDSQFSTQQVSSQHETPLVDSFQIQQIGSMDENPFDSQCPVETDMYVQEIPLETSVQEIPLDTTVQVCPIETTVDETPLENTVQVFPIKTCAEQIALENTVQVCPIDTSVEQIALENTVQVSPITTTVEEIPLDNKVQEIPLDATVEEILLGPNEQGSWNVKEVGVISSSGTSTKITETTLEPTNGKSWNVEVVGTIDSGEKEKKHTFNSRGSCHGTCYNQSLLEELKQKCHRLERDKEYMEGRYDELKRERDTLEVRFTELASSMHDCRTPDRLKDFIIDTSHGEFSINTITDYQHGDNDDHHNYQSYDTSSYPNSPRDYGRMDSKWEAEIDYYRSKFEQVKREKELLERAFKGEKRRNEEKERDYDNEQEERRHLEEENERLSTNVSRMQETIRGLRRDNDILTKSLKTLERSPITLQGQSIHHTSSVSNVTELSEYKSNVEVLERENKEFRDILAQLDGRKCSSNSMDDMVREKELIEIKREKNKLEAAIKDLKRTVKHQQERIEEIRRESDEDGLSVKDSLRKLQRKNKEHERILQDRDRELETLKKRNFEEFRLLEVKFRSEVSAKAQLQKQIIDFQNRVQRLEKERDSLTEQMRSTYQKDAFCTNLGSDNDMDFLRKRLEEEHQCKVRLANDIKYLLNDINELRNRNRQLEDNFGRERMEIQATIEKQAGEITQTYTDEINKLQLSLAEEVRRREQLEIERESINAQMAGFQLETGTQDGCNIRTRLEEEVKRREALEVENKNLLYEMNKMLTKARKHITDTDDGEDGDTNKVRKLMRQKEVLEKSNRDLVKEVEEFKDKIEELQGSAKDIRELKRTNKELEDEVIYLKRKREEMDNSQKNLQSEIDRMSSSLNEYEKTNRKLSDDLERLTRKIDDMEDEFKNEKTALARKYDREKDKAVDEMSKLKDDAEFRLKEQMITTRQLESTIKNLEYQMRTMASVGPLGGTCGSDNGSVARQQMNTYVESLKKQIESLEDSVRDKNRRYEDEAGKFEAQKRRMLDDFDREKQTLKQCFEREKADLERRLKSLESGMRGEAVDGRRQFEMEKNDLERRHMMEINKLQTDFGRQLDDERNKIKSVQNEMHDKVKNLMDSKRDLEERLRELNNRYKMEKQDYEYRSTEEKRRNKEEIGDEIRRKIDSAKQSYEEEITRLKRANEREKENFKDKLNKEKNELEKKFQYERENFETKMQVKMSDVVRDYKDEMNKLEQKLQKQLSDAENQKFIMTTKLDRQKEELTRAFEQEKRRLTDSIQTLKRELQSIKHEQRGNRDDRWRQEIEMKDNIERIRREEISRIETEFEEKISSEKRRMKNSVDDMRRKLSNSEQKVKDLEVKLDDEKQRFEKDKLEMEKKIIHSQQDIKNVLEVEYKKQFAEEKSRFEKTLETLNKQVSCLQEQRRQIQAKLVSRESLGGSFDNVTSEVRKNLMAQLEQDYNSRLEREKRPLEDKLSDMKHELEKLKREKTSIKKALEEEKADLEDELEKLRNSMREKLMKAREDFEKQNDVTHQSLVNKLNSLTGATNEDNNNKFYQEQMNILEQRNLSLQAKNERLEKELKVATERIRDLETRRREMTSSGYNPMARGYPYSGPKGPGGSYGSPNNCGSSGNYGSSDNYYSGHPDGFGQTSSGGGMPGEYGYSRNGSAGTGVSSQYNAIIERANSNVPGYNPVDPYYTPKQITSAGGNLGPTGAILGNLSSQGSLRLGTEGLRGGSAHLPGNTATLNVQNMAASRSLQGNYGSVTPSDKSSQQLLAGGLNGVLSNKIQTGSNRLSATSALQGSRVLTQSGTSCLKSPSTLSNQKNQLGFAALSSPAGLNSPKKNVKFASPLSSPSGAPSVRRFSQDLHNGTTGTGKTGVSSSTPAISDQKKSDAK